MKNSLLSLRLCDGLIICVIVPQAVWALVAEAVVGLMEVIGSFSVKNLEEGRTPSIIVFGAVSLSR